MADVCIPCTVHMYVLPYFHFSVRRRSVKTTLSKTLKLFNHETHTNTYTHIYTLTCRYIHMTEADDKTPLAEVAEG